MTKIPVFDIGDTLTPSKKFSIEFFEKELKRQGIENPPKYPYEGYNEMDVDSIQEWFERDEIDADAAEAVNNYKKAKKEKLEEFKVFEMLKNVQEEIKKPGIISDNRVAAKEFYQEMFDEKGIDIDGFVVSEEIGVKKPDKRIFEEFLDSRSVKGGECVYFGNNIPRDSACEKTGMKFVLVEQFEVFGDSWRGEKIQSLSLENVERKVKDR